MMWEKTPKLFTGGGTDVNDKTLVTQASCCVHSVPHVDGMCCINYL
ncbi:hypothetical protein H6F32_13025 [Anabaena sp. FACHB-1237]|nr:hypothetical protein [Anabaena sp. FACHB-1237]MBD2138492.1 hypothetical protein [Anabaena sp. FACHB-1237]